MDQHFNLVVLLEKKEKKKKKLYNFLMNSLILNKATAGYWHIEDFFVSWWHFACHTKAFFSPTADSWTFFQMRGKMSSRVQKPVQLLELNLQDYDDLNDWELSQTPALWLKLLPPLID